MTFPCAWLEGVSVGLLPLEYRDIFQCRDEIFESGLSHWGPVEVGEIPLLTT